jgi:hypothetical protein
MDLSREVNRILNPDPEDKLLRRVRGALKMVISQQGKITGSTLDIATKQIVSQLTNGNSAGLLLARPHPCVLRK